MLVTCEAQEVTCTHNLEALSNDFALGLLEDPVCAKVLSLTSV